MDDESKEYVVILTIVFILLGLTFMLSAYWHKPTAKIEMYTQGFRLDYVDIVLLPNWNGTFTVEVVNVGDASTKLDYTVEPVSLYGLSIDWNCSDVKLKQNEFTTAKFWITTTEEVNVNEIYIKVMPTT